jgi:histidine ammonia-lyase
VQSIADELVANGDAPSAQAIRAAVNTVTHDRPLEVDIAGVKACLVAGGWPLAESGLLGGP